MTPMYKLCGWDPWNWWSVTKDAKRTTATIKQYTRWGIGDIYFLAVSTGICEPINTEIELLKGKSVKLKNGRTLEDMSFILKVTGFLSDFGIDRLMQCKRCFGHWPQGDHRRFILSDQSEIDANNFASVGLSSGACMVVRVGLWIHQHLGTS